jgi:hypothetical protein
MELLVKNFTEATLRRRKGKGKVKEPSLQALTGSKPSWRLRLQDFKTVGTSMWQGC